MRLSRTLVGLLERRATRASRAIGSRSATFVRSGHLELAAFLSELDYSTGGTATPVYGVPVVPPPSAQLSHPESELSERYRHAG